MANKKMETINIIFIINAYLQMSYTDPFGLCMFCLVSLPPSHTLGYNGLIFPSMCSYKWAPDTSGVHRTEGYG